MLTTKDVMELLRQRTEEDEAYFYEQSDYWHYGVKGTSKRVAAVAELAAANFPGDLAEIGCASGRTTVRLAEVARRHGKRVLAIDLWERDESDYDWFKERIAPYGDLVVPTRMKSQESAAIALLKRPLCFAWVDGEHTYKALLSDIQAVSHAGVIAVDDILWDWPLLRAFHEGARRRQPIRHPWCNEGYIV